MMKKILIVFLIIALSFSAFACKKKKTEETVPNNAPVFDGGVHESEYTETDRYIFKNGASDYSIVISASAPSIERTAAVELAEFLYQSTGQILNVVTDDNIAWSQGTKAISLGKNTLSTAAEVTYDYNVLGTQGFRIKTVGDTVFIGGYGGYGTLYGAYEFLSLTVNYDYFYTDCISIDKNVKDIKLYDYNITDVPDIEFRDATYGYVSEDVTVANRYRMMRREVYIIPIDGTIGHNANTWFGVSSNLSTHPDWFNKTVNPTQPCYTAHGNDAERALMLEYAVELLKREIRNNPDKRVVLFCNEDNSEVCECDSCKSAKEYYGADSGAMLKMINEIKSAIDEWFLTEEGREYERDLMISFYAYTGYEEAPHANIECLKNVVPYIAPIHADYMVSMLDEANAGYRKTIEEWAAISNDVHFYFYDTNYSFYFTPYNTFDSLQDNYKFAASLGSSCMHMLGQPNQTNISTGFSVLKMYLESKLGWNVNADIEALTDKFFENYFGPGAEDVRKFFDEYRVHAVYQHDALGYNGVNTIYRNPLTRALWSQQLLESWNSYLEDAFEKIAPLEKDEYTTWKSYYNKIATEKINVNYIYVEVYGSFIEASLKRELQLQTKEYASMLGLKYFKENTTNGPISSLWSSWNI